MAEPLIQSHVWRPLTGDRTSNLTPYAARPCCYVGCGRPRAGHARPATGPRCPCPAFDLEQAFDSLCLCDHGWSKHPDGGACTAVLT
jgi:hypothetical protein